MRAVGAHRQVQRRPGVIGRVARVAFDGADHQRRRVEEIQPVAEIGIGAGAPAAVARVAAAATTAAAAAAAVAAAAAAAAAAAFVRAATRRL